MPPSLSTLLVLACFALQGWLMARALRFPGLCRLERVLGAWLMIWLSLVLGGGLCAAFTKMSHATWYFGVNALVFLALLGAVVLARSRTRPSAGPPLFSPWQPQSRWDRGILLACAALFTVGFIVVVLVGWWHGPTLDDCIACKLPRTGFFALTGNLLPPADWNNTRIFGAPPYCSMLQLPFWVAGSDVASYNLLGSFTWLLMAGAIYLAGRICGASPPAAAVSAFAFNFCALVLQKGSSENDDLLAALPTVLAVYFFVTGCKAGGTLRFVLAGIAFGLALGGKLLSLYLGVPVILIWAWSFWNAGRTGIVCGRSALWRGGWAFSGAVLLTGVVFFVQNWFMYGFPLPRSELIAMNRNTPFVLGTFAYSVASQSLACLSSAAVNFAALLDWLGVIERDSFASFVNSSDSALRHIVLDHLSRVPAPYSGDFSIAPYDVARTYDPMRELNESNNSFGILGVTLLGAMALARRGEHRLAWVFISVGFLAFLQYCLTFKFILQTTRYFTPFVAMGMPLVALAADRCRAGRGRLPARALMGVTVFYTALFIIPAWWHGRDRQIQRLTANLARSPLPVEENTSPGLVKFLHEASEVNLLDTYEVPFLPFLQHGGTKSLRVNDLSSLRAPMLVGTFWKIDAVTASALGGLLWPVPVDFARPGITFAPVGAAPISHFFFHERMTDAAGAACLLRTSARQVSTQDTEVSLALFSLAGGVTDDMEIACGEPGADVAALVWQPASRELKVSTRSDQMEAHLRLRTTPGKTYKSHFPVRRWFPPSQL